MTKVNESAFPDVEETLKSPGSLMGSSIGSKNASSFDIEDSSHTSWRIGMPWFQSAYSRYNNSPIRNTTGGTTSAAALHNNTRFANTSVDENRYFGGVMKSTDGGGSSGSGGGVRVNRSPLDSVASSSPGGMSPFQRTRSQDSIGDFNESEWTPPDSSYGAACPVCGCVPKHVRRMVEFSMIAAMVVGFVYLLITTSINLSDERNRSRSNGRSNTTSSYAPGSGQSALTDDDVYIEYNYKTADDAVVAAKGNAGNDDLGMRMDDSLTNDDYANRNSNNNKNKNGGKYYYYKYNNGYNGYGDNDGSNYNKYGYNSNLNNDAYQAEAINDSYNYDVSSNDDGGGGRERIRYLRSWL